MKIKFLIPLALFLVLVGFLMVGLKRDPREVPSPLINKAAPAFDVPQLENPATRFSAESMKGKVWILNVWASWCVSCREEHPLLIEFSKSHQTPLVGLDYKDQPKEGMKYLSLHGNPYTLIAQDLDGKIGIDYGVYGVPESYVIDKQGIIRYKQIGPFTTDAIEKTLLPLIAELEKS